MTTNIWPAWALTNNERCQEHDDPGCPICTPPLDEADYQYDDPDDMQREQNRYEEHMGWGRDQA